MNDGDEVRARSYNYFFIKKTVFKKRELLPTKKRELLRHTCKYTQISLNKIIEKIFLRILNKCSSKKKEFKQMGLKHITSPICVCPPRISTCMIYKSPPND